MPVIAEINGYRLRYLDGVRDLVLEVWPARGAARTRARRALGHALEFSTWQSLVRRQGCTNGQAAALMLDLVRAATR
jgi:hypothetical protein